MADAHADWIVVARSDDLPATAPSTARRQSRRAAGRERKKNTQSSKDITVTMKTFSTDCGRAWPVAPSDIAQRGVLVAEPRHINARRPLGTQPRPQRGGRGGKATAGGHRRRVLLLIQLQAQRERKSEFVFTDGQIDRAIPLSRDFFERMRSEVALIFGKGGSSV